MLRTYQFHTLLIILFVVMGASLIPTKLSALNPGDVVVSMTTAPFFIADSNSPPAMDGPKAAYIGFEVCNNTGGVLNDLNIEMTNITGTVPGFALTGGQDPIQFIGTLAVGECQTYYWYVEYPYALKDETGTFEVTVSDANPGVVTFSEDVLTRNSISANAGGQVLTSSIGPGIFVGQVFYIDVQYSFGSVQNGDEFTFQPAGNLNYDASCYQLIAGEITSSDLGGVGIPVGTQNQFYFTATSNMGGSGNLLTVRYFFRSLCVGVGTNAIPYAGQTSGGNNFKYTGNFDTNSVLIPPSTNTINVTKVANPNFFAAPPGVSTFTVTLENTSNQFVMVDRIDDILPAPFEYDALTVNSEVTASNSTSLPTMAALGAIAWVGNEPETFPYFSYLISPMSTLTLEYTVNIPPGTADGNYENSVTATMGTFTTPPATASVGIGSCVVDIDCPSDITVNADPAKCDAIVTFPDATATGNCTPITVMQTGGPVSGSVFPVGTTVIEYTATDAMGNVATCSFNVTVVDNEPPVISCPMDMLVNSEPGVCGATVNYSVTGSDNCSGEVINQLSGLPSGSFYDLGIYTHTFEIVDASGNSAMCSFEVEVVDNLSPQISCPSDMVLDTDPGQCGRLVTFIEPVGVDNCPNPVTMQTAGLPSNTFYSLGTVTNTFAVTDASGNGASCSFDITVVDSELPQIMCPADIVVDTDPGSCDAVVTFSVTTSDNCPGETFVQTLGLPSGSTFPLGTTTQTFEVTDASGNKNTCSFDIVVEDNSAPTITCPSDVAANVDPGQCTAAVSYTVSFDDNCPGSTIMQTSGLASGSDFPVGTTTNCFTVTDGSGNAASCCFDVVVTDNEDPMITCPADVDIDNDPGQCGATVLYSVSDSDNCPGSTVMQTAGLPSGALFPIGTTTNCFTVTDASGNTASCCFDVTIMDAEDPTINCPNDIVTMTDMGVCNAVVDNIPAITSDNCGVTSVSYTLTGATTGSSPLTGINDASGTTFEEGVTTVEYTVTDDNGITATCSFTVTVNDLNDLSITCPMDVDVMTDMGECFATVDNLTPATTDNCGIESLSYTLTGATTGASPLTGINDASGEIFNVGVTTVEYIVTDVNGNMAMCSFTVTVNDDAGLSITCPMDVVVPAELDECDAVVDNLTPTVTDNCGVASVVYILSGATNGSSPPTGINDASGETFNVGVTTVTYIVEDDNGNLLDCSFTVTVLDLQDPTITCPMDIVINTIPDQCGNTVVFSVPFGDNCPGAQITQTAGLPSGSFFPVGVTTNTFEVTDASGNTVSCSFDVEIVDNDSPMISCPSDIVVNTSTISCDAVVNYTPPVGIDNCPGATTMLIAGLPDGGTFPLGLTTVTYEVTDAVGNTATCSFDVLVEDMVDPELSCPTDFSVDTDPGQCGAIVNYSVTGTDNCITTTITQTSGIPTGNSYPVGMTTNTFEITDGAGNTETCSFTVTVEDNEDPTLACPSDIMVNADPGECSAVVDFMVMGNDNCPGFVVMQTAGLPSGSMFPVGTTTVEFEVTDASGNTATCSFDVIVEDATDPVINCPADIVVNTDPGICGATVDFTVTSNDNCTGSMVMQVAGLPSGSTFPVGVTTNTFVVTDNAGNSVACSFEVEVVDNESPMITCPSDISVDNDPDACGAVIDYLVPVGTDNCSGSVTSLINGLGSGELFPVGTTTVTYEVVDASGNTALCSFDVTVTDISPPTINCPTDFTVNTDPDACGAVVDIPITFDDNCSSFVVTQISLLGDGDFFPLGTTTVEYEATDGMNTETCSFDITVEDMVPPVLNCPPTNFVVGLDPGECEGVVDFDITATDNCDPDPVVMQTAGGPLQSGDVFPIGSYPFSYKATDDSGNMSTCDFTLTVVEFMGPGTIACNDLITVAVDENGIGVITADMILEGDYGCYDDFILSQEQVDCSDIGQLVIITITDPDTGNSCSTVVEVEDNLPPEIECPIGPTIISCLDDVGDVPPPNAYDNCTPATVELVNQMLVDNDPCDDNMTVVILTWIATDAYGNVSEPCEQTVELIRPNSTEVDFPDDIEWDCTEYDAFPNITGATPLTGNLATTGSGVPSGVNGLYCGYSSTFTDQVFQDCGNTFHIVRTWLVVDICTNQVITMNNQGEDNVQIISVTDNTPPTVDLNDFELGVNVPGNGNSDCNAQNFLPPPTVTDDCSDWMVFIYTPVGEALYINGVDGSMGGVIPPPGLGLGSHTITYLVVDDCGNETQVEVEVTIVDDTAPVAICDEITDVSLTSNGEAIVPALVFDDGSYDNCSPVSFRVRRKDGDCEGNFDDFGDAAIFCCSDIPNNPIIVILEVMDEAGNVNTCEVIVEVEDKLNPITEFCPPNETISCDLYIDEYGVPLNNGMPEVLDDFGTALFFDNCDLDIEYDFTINLDNCQSGTIVRTWQATDPSGNQSQVCTQIIFIEHESDWVVEFPDDVTVTCTDGQLPDLGEPEIFFDECELIGVSYEDEYFYIVQDACYKILRHYILVNWCVFDEIGYDAFEEFPESNYFADWDGDGDSDDRTFRDGWNSDGSPGDPDGYIAYTQVIKIIDEEAPDFVIPEINGCVEETDCITNITLPYPVINDDCSTTFEVNITGELGSYFAINGNVIVDDVVPGNYEVEYEVTDNCGNTSYETIVVEVIDCKLPTPKCLNGIVVEIMQTQMIEVDAVQLDWFSFDNCPGDLLFSFSPDVTETTLLFTCDDIGEVPVEIWVTDATGNQDYCETFIEVQDNMGFCTGNQTTVSVAGLIATEEDIPIESVMVDVNGGLQTMFTAADGLYDMDLPINGDYSVVPQLDQEPLNGVTTYDMVLITQHILGIVPLDSPYKLIAADANNSGSVSTLDLVAIQKLILILEDNFPNNTSWRFVEAAYEFPNPADPWEEVFPEVVSLNDLTADELETDFVGVKVGDVNGSAQANGLDQTGDRTLYGDLVFQTGEQTIKAGQTTEVWFTGTDQEVLGYQFTLHADPSQVVVEEVLYGVADRENFGDRFLSKGDLTASWHQGEATMLHSDEAQFGLRLRAVADVRLSEVLRVSSDLTGAEAYGPAGELLDVQLQIGSDFLTRNEYILYQNVPNPFAERTSIGFYLPEATSARMVILDVTGRVVDVIEGDYSRGYQEIVVDNLAGSGVYYYRLETANFEATRKMILK